jgi:D-alanyl-D-alanine carboxypeptidase
MVIDKAQKSSVTTQVELTQEVAAPVSKGQSLGTLTVKAGEQIIMRLPLVAEKTVERLSWSDLFLQALRGMIAGR